MAVASQGFARMEDLIGILQRPASSARGGVGLRVWGVGLQGLGFRV